MSENYLPDQGANATSLTTFTALLSQRDVALAVPINFVTAPGVSLTAACFPFGRYEDDTSADCLSNLIAVGFRRLELDLYWDQTRKLWSFCPVAIPTRVNASVVSSSQSISVITSTLSSLTSTAVATVSFGVRQASSDIVSDDTDGDTPTATSNSGSTGSTATTLGALNPTVSVLPNNPDTPLVTIGPYTCTETINLSTFTSQMLDYIQKTEFTLAAHLIYTILNIHAVASDAEPTEPAPAPASSNLPGPNQSLGTIFAGNLSSYLYTPANLKSDRVDLNSTWFAVPERFGSIQDYYDITIDSKHVASTTDGWPSEGYIEFSKSKRLLLGWGTVDPQMAAYNFSMDSSTIFPAGDIQDIETDISTTTSRRLKSGCFLNTSTEQLSRINSSWAMSANLAGFSYPTSSASDLIPLLNLTQNTTACGISPILNTTLLNATAYTNYLPYFNFSTSAIWSWAPSEPKNYTSQTPDGASPPLYRCASISSELSYHWVVSDCSLKTYAACRSTSINPRYNWTITTYPISYSYASPACPSGYTFDVPRTALENSYLGLAIRESKREYDGHGTWIDFNSLDVRGCWTSGGPNATCPYTDTLAQENNLKKRVILVPTVAAIIVLVITVLTLVAKITGNRSIRKRARKRAENGFVYEGVPS